MKGVPETINRMVAVVLAYRPKPKTKKSRKRKKSKNRSVPK